MEIPEGVVVAIVVTSATWLAQLVSFFSLRQTLARDKEKDDKNHPIEEKKAEQSGLQALGEGAEAMARATKTMVDALSGRVMALEELVSEQSGYIRAIEEDLSNANAELLRIKKAYDEEKDEGINRGNRIIELEQTVAGQEKEIRELRSKIKGMTPGST
jgi:uncharacterized coiled-coil protein SlyX